ncbi:MAG: CotH kinase family protein [Bacteroidales bacterium]|nr:CotH kinase family protein [Bacteroidales bacterium]
MFRWISSLFLIVSLIFFVRCNKGPDREFFAGITSSNLPVLLIDTHGERISGRKRANSVLYILEPEDFITLHSGIYNISIKKRGLTSMSIPKPQLGFKLKDQNGKNLESSLLGLVKDHHWVLHGPYFDKTLLRNFLTFELWSRLGYYAPQTRFVELYFKRKKPDGEFNNSYAGIYLLTEKIEKHKNKVFISSASDNLSQDDLSFIIELIPEERLVMVDNYFQTDISNSCFTCIYPGDKKADDGTKLNDNYKNQIKQYIDTFESSLYKEEQASTLPEYLQFIDVENFVDYTILNELVKNPDTYHNSDFFHKNRKGKLVAGPVWDYNVAYGGISWAVGSKGWFLIHLERFWNDRFFRSEYFVKKYKERWKELRANGIISADTIFDIIDDQVAILHEASIRNFETWKVLGKNLKDLPGEIPDTYNGEIEYLKQFLSDRIHWIDDNIDSFETKK